MSATLPVLAIYAASFGLMYRNIMDRHLAMLAGAAAILLLGFAMDFYSIKMAIDSIYFETLSFIFGMSLISATLSRSGLFSKLAVDAALYAGGSVWATLVILSLITYSVSLFVNNLAAIVVILPITLRLCRTAGINPIPIAIAEIIASNLGGASTMVGDFPNMIISSVADLEFLDFIGGMMVPCLMLLAAMFLFFRARRQELCKGSGSYATRKQKVQEAFGNSAEHSIKDRYLLQVGLTVLAAVVGGFLLTQYFDVRPSYITLAAGLILLVIGKFEKSDLKQACSVNDMLFFAGLFVMVGGLNAAGFLASVSGFIDSMAAGNHLAQLLLLMWISSIVTAFLNAGPSTAFFVPVAMEMSYYIPGDVVWWALSLGVLAGSSASLTGATAGSIASTQINEYIDKYPDVANSIHGEGRLDFKEFLRWGVPIMFGFLILSTFYIMAVQ